METCPFRSQAYTQVWGARSPKPDSQQDVPAVIRVRLRHAYRFAFGTPTTGRDRPFQVGATSLVRWLVSYAKPAQQHRGAMQLPLRTVAACPCDDSHASAAVMPCSCFDGLHQGSARRAGARFRTTPAPGRRSSRGPTRFLRKGGSDRGAAPRVNRGSAPSGLGRSPARRSAERSTTPPLPGW